jgi:hypothetical protein
MQRTLAGMMSRWTGKFQNRFGRHSGQSNGVGGPHPFVAVIWGMAH